MCVKLGDFTVVYLSCLVISVYHRLLFIPEQPRHKTGGEAAFENNGLRSAYLVAAVTEDTSLIVDGYPAVPYAERLRSHWANSRAGPTERAQIMIDARSANNPFLEAF